MESPEPLFTFTLSEISDSWSLSDLERLNLSVTTGNTELKIEKLRGGYGGRPNPSIGTDLLLSCTILSRLMDSVNYGESSTVGYIRGIETYKKFREIMLCDVHVLMNAIHDPGIDLMLRSIARVRLRDSLGPKEGLMNSFHYSK
jgi:hypothetical protein